MKDLFVFTADSDAQAVMGSILKRDRELGTRAITFDIERFSGRDSGMVKEGPEIIRAKNLKQDYAHVLLMWDHHGSGWERKLAAELEQEVQQRLDGVTWAGRSSAIVVEPELEEWLWWCPGGLARYLGYTAAELESETERMAKKLKCAPERATREKPKETFEAVYYRKRRKRPLPEDFEALGRAAEIAEWLGSSSFARLADVLRVWFPASG